MARVTWRKPLIEMDDPLSVWLKLRSKLNNTDDDLLEKYRDEIISSLGGIRSILQDYLLNADILQQFDKNKTKSLLNTLYKIQESQHIGINGSMHEEIAHPHPQNNGNPNSNHGHFQYRQNKQHHQTSNHVNFNLNHGPSSNHQRYSVDLSALASVKFKQPKRKYKGNNLRGQSSNNHQRQNSRYYRNSHNAVNILNEANHSSSTAQSRQSTEAYNDKYPITSGKLSSLLELPQSALINICTFLTICDNKSIQLSCCTLTPIARLPSSKYIAISVLNGFQFNICDAILCIANNNYYLYHDDDHKEYHNPKYTKLTFRLHDIAKLLAREDIDERLFKRYVKKLMKTGVLTKIIRFMSESSAISVQEQCIWIIKKIVKFSESFASKMVSRGALDGYLRLFYLNDPIFTRKILKGIKKLCEYQWIIQELLNGNKLFQQIIYKYYQQISYEGTAATNIVQNSVYIDNCVELISYLYSNNLFLPDWSLVVSLFPIIVRLLLSKRIIDIDILRHILSTIAKISHNDKLKNEHIRLLLSYSYLLMPFLVDILKSNMNDDDICCSVMNIIGNILKYDGDINKKVEGDNESDHNSYEQFIEIVLKHGFIDTLKPFLAISANSRLKQETLRVLINILNNGNQHQIGYLLSHQYLHKYVADICISDDDTNTIKFGVVYLFTALKLINDKRIMASNNVVVAFIHLLNLEKHKSNQILFAALRGLNAFYPIEPYSSNNNRNSNNNNNNRNDEPLTIFISKLIMQSENCISRLKEIEQNPKLNSKTRNLSAQIQKNVSLRVFYHQ